MALFFQSDLDQVQKFSYQLNNFWEFYISTFWSTSPDSFEGSMKFKIKSINLPRFKLVTERLRNGDVIYNGIEFESTVSMNIMETSDMGTFEYFDSWQNTIFDKSTMRFRALTTSQKRQAFRTGLLKLHKYEANLNVINNTLFNSTLKNSVDSLARSVIKVPKTSNPKADNMNRNVLNGSAIVGNRALSSVGDKLIPQVTKKQSGIFEFSNMKFVSIEDSEFDYTNGEPLSYNVNFEVEEIFYRNGRNLPVD